MAPSALSPNPSTTTTTYSYGSLHRPTKKMSITQTFYLAHKARGKLSSEATRSDHNLRLLVGHANLLDSLMIHLAHAEAEQERWYYNTVRGNEEWQETESEDYGSLAADYESETESESESDFDSEEESEDEEEVSYRPRAQPTTFKSRVQEVVVGVHEIEEHELDDEEEEVEDEEFDEDGMFTLTRTTSHRPPSLCSDLSDEEDEEEEESTPPSPESVEHRLPVSEKEFHEVSRSYFDSQLHSSSIHDHDQPMLFEERMGLSTMIAPVY